MLRAGDHHSGLCENWDSIEPQITTKRFAQTLKKLVTQFEMSLFAVYVMMGNAGGVCNACSLLFLTFFDFDALTQPFHCYTFLLAGPYCHLAGKWIFLWGLIQLPMTSAKIFPFVLTGAGLGPCL